MDSRLSFRSVRVIVWEEIYCRTVTSYGQNHLKCCFRDNKDTFLTKESVSCLSQRLKKHEQHCCFTLQKTKAPSIYLLRNQIIFLRVLNVLLHGSTSYNTKNIL